MSILDEKAIRSFVGEDGERLYIASDVLKFVGIQAPQKEYKRLGWTTIVRGKDIPIDGVPPRGFIVINKEQADFFLYTFDANNRRRVSVANGEKRHVGHIYLFENKPIRKVKIGLSIDPTRRVKSLAMQAGLEKNQYSYFLSSKIDNDTVAEVYLHKVFESRRAVGEYFNITIQEARQELARFLLEN